jgi:hypothetical protein
VPWARHEQTVGQTRYSKFAGELFQARHGGNITMAFTLQVIVLYAASTIHTIFSVLLSPYQGI